MEFLFYIGTYSVPGSRGIYQGVLDTDRQSLKIRADYPEHVENPSFLAVTRDRLYAVNELQEGGAVTTYARNAVDGSLTFLNRFATEGAGMCHVTAWPDQRHISMANYNSGSLVVCELDGERIPKKVSAFVQHHGIGYDREGRQEGPHMHSTGISQDGSCLYAADLGLDQLFCYQVKEGSLNIAPEQMQVRVPAGEGPRHFVFSPDEEYLYLVTEMGNRLHVMKRAGALRAYKRLQSVSTLPEESSVENTAADIHFSADYRYLYVSNRGENCITGYLVDGERGMAECIGYFPSFGEGPRNFCLTPDGGYMLIANQFGGNVVLCSRDRESGRIGSVVSELKIPQPVFVTVVD